MKYVIFFIGVIVTIDMLPISVADQYPDLEYYVTDHANVLTLEEELSIEELCIIVYDICGAEMAILIVNTTQPEDINIFSTRTFQQNGLGQEGKDNGLLLLITTDDRLWRIEVGYGLEGALPDAKVGYIATTYLVPYLEQGDYYTGLYGTVDYLGGEIVANYDGTHPTNNSPYPISWIPLTFWQLLLIVAIIIGLAILTRGHILLLFLLFIGRGRGGKRWGGGRTGGGGAGGKW